MSTVDKNAREDRGEILADGRAFQQRRTQFSPMLEATDVIIVETSAIDKGRFTHLFARITEEDDSYVVQVRLHNGSVTEPENTAWGEEVAPSMETAAEMITALAKRFSIPQDRIRLEIRMDDIAASTHH